MGVAFYSRSEMMLSDQHRDIDEIVAALDGAERLDDVRSVYDEAIRMRWRRWPDFLVLGLIVALSSGVARAWASADLTLVAIYSVTLVLALAFGWPRIARFARLDRAISRWKSVADARAAAGKH
jgi:hypothetical protein